MELSSAGLLARRWGSPRWRLRREMPFPTPTPRAPEATRPEPLRTSCRPRRPPRFRHSLFGLLLRPAPGRQALPPTGSISGACIRRGPLIDLSIWQQVALSIPRLGPLSWSHGKSTSCFDHMASCRQVDMSSSPTVDISLLPDLHARFGLGAAHRMSSGVGGHSRLPDRRGTMAPAATPRPTVPRAAVLGAPPSPGDPTRRSRFPVLGRTSPGGSQREIP
jgi:hypothetical protein